MSRKEVSCHCGEILHFENGFNGLSKDVLDQNWGVIPTFTGKMLYACPPCYTILKECAEKMYQTTGDKYIAMSHLLNK